MEEIQILKGVVSKDHCAYPYRISSTNGDKSANETDKGRHVSDPAAGILTVGRAVTERGAQVTKPVKWFRNT